MDKEQNKMRIPFTNKKIMTRVRLANSYRMVTDSQGNRHKVTEFPWFETYPTIERSHSTSGRAFNFGRLYVHVGRA